jgi:hypothetical protein
MPTTLLRLMGESDIIDIDPSEFDGAAHPRLMGLDAADRINLLGHWLDHDQGEAMSDDPDTMLAMTAIGAAFLAEQAVAATWGSEVNFVVMTILREKWPVGSKSKYRLIADRVGASHTYLANICAAAKLDDLNDEAALKQSETAQLMMALPNYRQNRKRYANSSAVQTLIRQGL